MVVWRGSDRNERARDRLMNYDVSEPPRALENLISFVYLSRAFYRKREEEGRGKERDNIYSRSLVKFYLSFTFFFFFEELTACRHRPKVIAFYL